jgi:hypothetical protein
MLRARLKNEWRENKYEGSEHENKRRTHKRKKLGTTG